MIRVLVPIMGIGRVLCEIETEASYISIMQMLIEVIYRPLAVEI